MMWRDGLSRQILLSMAAVVVVAAVAVFGGSYVAFAVVAAFFPQWMDYSGVLPSGADLLILAVLTLPALVVASVVALKLAARILAPLNSLAESARRIASGDLTARASPGDRNLGETAHLVHDFNVMAQKLQDMANDMAAWNAAIAHELRTPLTILRGKLQGIADGVFTVNEDLIANLLLQTEGLSRLVDDLQVVTLADSGHLRLKTEPIVLATEVRHVLDLLGPSLKAAGFRVEPTLVDIVIAADGTRIRQALLALLENARRYATPGRIDIMTLVSGQSAVIRVEDDGPGLPREFAKRAFEPFTRLDSSRSRRYGGSGLGLSVVRAIAEAHGGTAAYRTSSRGGAAFEISLPMTGVRAPGPASETVREA